MKSMRNRRRNLLPVLAATLLAVIMAGVLSACTTVDREQQIIDAGYIHEVTYDANGGTFDSRSDVQYEYVRVQENSLTVEPGYRPAGAGELNIISVPTRTGYDLLGWQQVLFDDEGNETGLSEEYWDFKADRVTGNITLRADWAQRGELAFNITVNGEVITFDTTFRISAGESFLSNLYDADSTGGYTLREDYVKSNVQTQTADSQTYTLLKFYLDAELTQPLTTENAVFPDGEERLDLYAEYLVGNFSVLSDRNVAGTRSLRSNSNWYLVTDLDFSGGDGSPAQWDALSSFTGTIYGNGHSITGIEFRSLVDSRNHDTYRSIFGTMQGRVEDLTLEDISLVVYARWYDSTNKPDISIAFLANSFSGGVFDTVTLTDCTIRVINATREDADRGFTYNSVMGNWVEEAGSETSTVTGSATFTGEETDDSLIM